jgi:hypothetical protein
MGPAQRVPSSAVGADGVSTATGDCLLREPLQRHRACVCRGPKPFRSTPSSKGLRLLLQQRLVQCAPPYVAEQSRQILSCSAYSSSSHAEIMSRVATASLEVCGRPEPTRDLSRGDAEAAEVFSASPRDTVLTPNSYGAKYPRIVLAVNFGDFSITCTLRH